MPDESGGRPDAGSIRTYGPPVFTQWTAQSPSAPATGKGTAPPFVPEPAARGGAAWPDTAAPASARRGVEPGEYGPASDPEAPPAAGGGGIPSDAQAAIAAAVQAVSPTLGGSAAQGSVSDLAARLERLAVKLRADGAAALTPASSGSDRLDALLTGLLAGYLAGRDE